jgi:hypothetical protein
MQTFAAFGFVHFGGLLVDFLWLTEVGLIVLC